MGVILKNKIFSQDASFPWEIKLESLYGTRVPSQFSIKHIGKFISEALNGKIFLCGFLLFSYTGINVDPSNLELMRNTSTHFQTRFSRQRSFK